ncbi:hypothetical protein [Heyndrickxia sporothermodurans]|uniref:hypothetical protein n=1 Tax=Heyndrickxia sporothermodurans TaxID=46224 RepID=UPI000D38DCE1|nr:hypothetical protein [Heyndrickxia sporothermodurans]PTY93030.1 hypothetical protein B5V90_02805 [Heyndrickxia sporothermodurans]
MAFQNERHEKLYNRLKDDAIKRGFTPEEVSTPYLDKLSKQTKSGRIMKMISLAYHLGQMRGVKMCDELFHTEITLRDGIEEK